jgi:hypothetical protein
LKLAKCLKGLACLIPELRRGRCSPHARLQARHEYECWSR